MAHSKKTSKEEHRKNWDTLPQPRKAKREKYPKDLLDDEEDENDEYDEEYELESYLNSEEEDEDDDDN